MLSDVHLYRTDSLRPDGRVLRYYDPVPTGGCPPERSGPARADALPEVLSPEMRYNPLLGDYTVCAGFRMDRPQLPAADECPLCVGGYEAPEPYSVMVFDNRFPSLVLSPGEPRPGPFPPWPVRRGVGKCEVICYSPDHLSSLAAMAPDQVLFLVHAWTDRMEELAALADIRAVLIFENRGVEVGVTLHHPHGQLYAFDLVPPRLASEKANAAAAHAEGRCLFCEVVAGELRSGARVLWQSDRFLAVVPFFARYPYEVHVYARRHGCASLLDFDEADRCELAGILRYVAATYDAYCEGSESPMPYMMVCHQLHEENPGFHFHVEFYPVRRAPAKLKYAASVETGGGLWLCDAYPERSVQDLRRVGPAEPAFPSARVVGRSRRSG